MAQDTQTEREPFGRADSGKSPWRKWLALLLLLALLALVLYSAYYFSVNRRLPIPGLGRTSAEQVAPPQYLYSINGPEGADALTAPVAVAVSVTGRVFVTDSRSRVVRVYTVEGNYLFTISEIADGENASLGIPVSLAINSKNELFVSDRQYRAIYVFDLDGGYRRKIQPEGTDEQASWGPLGLSFDAEDNLYVTDVGRADLHRIFVFDAAGNEQLRFGSFGQAEEISQLPGALYFPNDVMLVEGEIYVSDSNNRRIQVFDTQGVFQRIIRTSGIPRGMDLDAEGRLVVADALAHQVDIYAPTGERLTGFGQAGIGPGQFRFTNDLSIDRRQRIFVTDRLNHQVQVWGWPEPLPIIPDVPETPSQWALCLSPFLLLPLLLLLRRRRFAVTEDFLIEMADAGLIEEMAAKKRWKWIVPAEEYPRYEGRELGGVKLEDLLTAEDHSESDAKDLMDRIGVERGAAVILVVAKRSKTLCTQDRGLAVAARALGIDAYDAKLFTERFLRKDEQVTGDGREE